MVDAPKPLSSARVAMAGLGLVKDLLLAFAAVLVEWSKVKETQAEDRAAVAETEARVAVGKAAIEKEQNAKEPVKAIDDFLAGR